ncbi:MAG: hypothetical protein JWQ08_1554 [Deinococcus sp.]|nr:hypothetical protein [Deinococcus sp.]
MTYHLALLVTALLLAVLLMLGLSLQLGLRKTTVRWPHHALFFAVCAGVVVSGGLALWEGSRGWALLPALALLLLMPRTRPGKAAHWRLALACAVAFVGGMWAAW